MDLPLEKVSKMTSASLTTGHISEIAAENKIGLSKKWHAKFYW